MFYVVFMFCLFDRRGTVLKDEGCMCIMDSEKVFHLISCKVLMWVIAKKEIAEVLLRHVLCLSVLRSIFMS